GYGQKFVVRGEMRGDDLPGTAVLKFQGLSPSPQEFRLKTDREEKKAVLKAAIDMTAQRSNFSFQVWVGDTVSPPDGSWHTVEVLPPPTLVALNGRPSPQIELHFPKYTELPSPVSLPPGSGNIEAVSGTQATLRAATDRPIARAWIESQPQ